MTFRFRGARRLAAWAVALVAGAALTLTTAAPASAANFDGNCNNGEVCLWYYYNYTGAFADFYNNVSNYAGWHFWNDSHWLDNNTRSAQNAAWFSCPYLTEFANGGGRLIIVDDDLTSLNNGNVDLNDRVSSHSFSFCP
jgi:hypothetical protein